MHHPTTRISHTPVVEHWLEREIAQWVHHEGSIQQPIAPWANTLTTELLKWCEVAWSQNKGANILMSCASYSLADWYSVHYVLSVVNFSFTHQSETSHGLCHTSCGAVVEHWLEREIAQWVHHEGSIWRPIVPWVADWYSVHYVLSAVNFRFTRNALSETHPSEIPKHVFEIKCFIRETRFAKPLRNNVSC